MKLVLRVVLGAALGLTAVGGLSLAVGKWWLVALVGAVTGVVGFLGSFFVWSADRPQDGYEQVLFDLPNSAISLALVVALVAAAFGGGALLGRGEAPGLPPEEVAAAASLSEGRVAMHNLVAAYVSEPKSGKLPEWRASLDAAKAASESVVVPERLSPLAVALASEAKSLSEAFAAQERCDAGETGACVDARIAAADAQRADAAFVASAGELGVA